MAKFNNPLDRSDPFRDRDGANPFRDSQASAATPSSTGSTADGALTGGTLTAGAAGAAGSGATPAGTPAGSGAAAAMPAARTDGAVAPPPHFYAAPLEPGVRRFGRSDFEPVLVPRTTTVSILSFSSLLMSIGCWVVGGLTSLLVGIHIVALTFAIWFLLALVLGSCAVKIGRADLKAIAAGAMKDSAEGSLRFMILLARIGVVLSLPGIVFAFWIVGVAILR